MSKFDKYTEAKEDHADLVKIVTDCRAEFKANGYGNGEHRFILRFADSARSVCSERLMKVFATVIQVRMPELLAEAAKFSDTDLWKLQGDAQDEAIAFIKSVGAQEAAEGVTHAIDS